MNRQLSDTGYPEYIYIKMFSLPGILHNHNDRNNFFLRIDEQIFQIHPMSRKVDSD